MSAITARFLSAPTSPIQSPQDREHGNSIRGSDEFPTDHDQSQVSDPNSPPITDTKSNSAILRYPYNHIDIQCNQNDEILHSDPESSVSVHEPQPTRTIVECSGEIEDLKLRMIRAVESILELKGQIDTVMDTAQKNCELLQQQMLMAQSY